MKNMTEKQEFFDKTIRHFVTQGERAMGNPTKQNPICVYRTDDGKSCAVGCHIPEEYYSPNMEGMSARRLLDNFPQLSQFIPSIDLAGSLQSVHDNPNHWQTPSEMVIELREIAHIYKLNTKVLDSLDFSGIKL